MASSRLVRGRRFSSKPIATSSLPVGGAPIGCPRSRRSRRLRAGSDPAGPAAPVGRLPRVRIRRQDREPRPRLLLRAADLARDPADRVEEVVGHALLEGNDAVVRDANALRTHLAAALRDVAIPDLELVFQELAAVEGVERMHVERRQLDQETRAGEVLFAVVADDVTHVLAQEALDALPELLDAVDVF